MDSLTLSRRTFLAATTTSMASGAVSMENQDQTGNASEQALHQKVETEPEKNYRRFQDQKKMTHNKIKKIQYPCD